MRICSVAARGVPEQAAVTRTVAATPNEQRMQDRPELSSGWRELVQLTRSVVGVRAALEDALLHQPAEAVGKNCLWHVEVHLEVAETPDAEESIAEDEQRPALADRLECTRQ